MIYLRKNKINLINKELRNPIYFNKYNHKIFTGISDELLNDNTKLILNCLIKKMRNKINLNTPFEEILLYDYKFYNSSAENNYMNIQGYCNLDNKIIYCEKGDYISLYHEISHSIQYNEEIINFNNSNLSEKIRAEQMADTMGYYLYNGIHSNEEDYVKSDDNDYGYFNKEYFYDFLKEYYAVYATDDVLLDN
jgi:hypothetical protein